MPADSSRPPVTGTRHPSAAGALAEDVAPPRLASHLGASGWVLDADAFGGGVFVASEYPVTVKAALLRLDLGGAPGDPEWDDLLLCGNTKPTQLRVPRKINTGITRTKRYCPAPDGTPANMAVLAHGIPHAGQTG
jgi:hypothetical protein